MPSRERGDTRRVCIFLPNLRPGGVERMFVQLARSFTETYGLAVDLVLCEARGPNLAEVPPSVRVIELKSPRLLKAVGPLARYLARERPAALLTGMPHPNVVALWARSRARADTRVVISEHSLLKDTAVRGRGLAWRVARLLARRYYGRADAIVAVSHEAARQVAAVTGLSPQRITVIHNAVVTDDVTEKMNADVRHPWLEPGGTPVVLSVGRLVAVKNFPTLIRAFARVRARRPLKLMILGEGDERPGLEALRDRLGLADDVALPGHVSNPFPYYARAAAFVMSSSIEGFGNALVEAMSAGTPVVSTRCGGPVEILDEGRYGLLVSVGNDEEMARAIESVLDHPVSPTLLKERAAEFSIARVAPQYLRCLGLAECVHDVTAQPQVV